MVSILINIKQHEQYYLIIPLIGLKTATLFKKRFWQKCFPVNFAKFIGTSFFIEHIQGNVSKRCSLRKIMNKRDC